MKFNKESIKYFFIPQIIFIVLVSLTDNLEIAVALSIQSLASALLFGFIFSLFLAKNKKYAYMVGSIVALIYPMVS